MKRLVTQFDDKRTRATVATPTCCCCCCCCLASILTSEAVTVLNARELVGRAERPETTRLGTAGAFLALPLAVAGGIAAGHLFSFVVPTDGALLAGCIAGIVAWWALLAMTYRHLGLTRRGRVIAVTIVAGTVLFVVEFYLGLLIILNVVRGGSLYLGLALLVPFLAVPLLRWWMVRLMRPAPS